MSNEPLYDDDKYLAKPETSALSVLDIIQQAIASKQDVETLRGLFELQRDFMKTQAEQAFNAAMARLQAKLPQIDKYGRGKNSRYAKLEDIDTIIRPLLAEEGFSFSFDEESHSDKSMTFLAKLSHKQGHSELKRLTLPIDASATNQTGKSIRPAIQDAGSTVSYARRYLISMHLNLITRDEDTDGEDNRVISQEQAREINTLIVDSGSDMGKFLRQIAGAEAIEAIRTRDFRRIVEVLEERKRIRQQQQQK